MTLPRLFPEGGSAGPVYRSGWEAVRLNGEQLPGRVRVQGAEIKARKDPKHAPGKNGGPPTFHGLESQPLEIVVQCWTDAQVKAAETIIRNIVLPSIGRNNAAAIDAPVLRTIKITSLVLDGVTQWKETTMPGGGRAMEFSIHATNWTPTDPTPATVNVKKKRRALPPSQREGAVNDESKKPPSQQKGTFRR